MANPETGDVAQSSEDASAGIGSDNLSALDAVAARIKSLEPENAEEPDSETEIDAEAEVEEEAATEETEETEESTTQEEIEGLEGLSDEEKQYLEENPESRLAKRFATLTRKRKEAEEALQAHQLSQQQKPEPEETPEPVKDNPFKDLGSIEDVATKGRELSELRDWMENLLEDHEDDLADDVVYEEGESSFTKKDVRKRLRLLRKEIDTFIPARKAEIKAVAQREHETTFFTEQAKTELEWMKDEDSKEFKAYSEVLGDDRFKADMEAIKAHAPNVASRMNWILAHFTNSLVGGSAPKPIKKSSITPSRKIPTTPSGNAGLPGKAKTSAVKQLAAIQRRYEESGRPEDGVAARAFKLEHNL